MFGDDSIERRQVLKVVGGASVGLGLAGSVSGAAANAGVSTSSPVAGLASPGVTEECGVDGVWQEVWRDISEGEEQVRMFERQTSYHCPVTVEFDVGPLDLEAFLTVDGRTPTQSDYDMHTDEPMESGGFTVEGDRLEPGDEIGLLVVGVDVPEDTGETSDDPDPPGDYLTIFTEQTDEPVQPVANLTLLTDQPTEGESVQFDGSDSFARIGSLESFEWAYERSLGGDSGSGSGEEFSFTPQDTGQYTVTLQVVDSYGRSSLTAETSINVDSGGDGGFCFITTATAREQPTLDSLRRFRNDSMATTPLGRGLVGLYYRVSPPLARAMDRHPQGRTARLCRWYVRRCAALSNRKAEVDSRPASAALGLLITSIYVTGLLIAVVGYAGIRISEILS
jgi:PKD repeat protein